MAKKKYNLKYNQFELQNPITNAPLGTKNPSELSSIKYYEIGKFGPDGMPQGVSKDDKGNLIYTDRKGDTHSAFTKKDPITNQIIVYADLPTQLANFSGFKEIEITDETKKPPEGGKTSDGKTKYRLPKEYLDAYMALSQGENKDYDFGVNNPTGWKRGEADVTAPLVSNILQGFSEGAMKQINKGVTADIGKRQGLKMAGDLGQAMLGKEGTFVDQKTGELTGGIPIDYLDMGQKAKIIGEIENKLSIARKQAYTNIDDQSYKRRIELGIANNAGTNYFGGILAELNGQMSSQPAKK